MLQEFLKVLLNFIQVISKRLHFSKKIKELSLTFNLHPPSPPTPQKHTPKNLGKKKGHRCAKCFLILISTRFVVKKVVIDLQISCKKIKLEKMIL